MTKGRKGSVFAALLVIVMTVAAVVRVAPAAAGSQSPLRDGAAAPVSGYRVVRSYPHDKDAYTQGLEFAGGGLFESTGLNGRSSIRRVQLETGKVLQRRDVSREHFGEGITIWGGRLIELTWQSNVAFVYDRDSFQPRGSFKYTGEGWGLTHNDTSLIMSDGTAELRFLEPATFKEQRRVRVTDAGRAVQSLNELEYVNGQVFANIWTTDRLARIDPQTGRVLGWVDLSGLVPASVRVNGDAVLNGIAYDASGDRLFVTGKLWPTLFEIKIVPRS